ncbi:MAG TPA: MlaD family protein [Trinickia sp.]|uniref:PqiB family protein n=1 Tax=Trinickia sp. TaxID=2571163 RepID=UPI002CB053E7|nr:MlaD family protein [Trinickia sp.]HTI19256.1 MlaD family protein [Trinickia sp.]
MQLIWLVPIVALLIGGWLAVKAILEQGPTITISFKTGEGLEAGKTKLKFKDVDIGVVKSVALSADHARVTATADVSKDAAKLLVDDTRFWVVRPRISGGTVSGLGTLLSGSYIGVDVGSATKPRRQFTGLETPPVFASDNPGREFVLKSADLGSLDVGAPVYFRRLQVGQISAYSLDPDGKGVTLRAFINAPYDRFVQSDSRFWHASGFDVTVDTNGIRVESQSVVSIVIGGIAFETPSESLQQTAAAEHTSFTLFENRSEAMQRHDRIVDKYVVNFAGSVRGLAIGAPVDFRGIVIGEVTAIYTRFDPKTRQFSIPVEINLYPERFTSRYERGAGGGGRLTQDPKAMANFLVSRGLRFQLRTGNLLTGQLFVAADFFSDAPKAEINWAATPPELPSVASPLQSLQDSISRLVTKLNGIPFEAIGNDARQTLAAANALLTRLDKEVTPQARDTLVAAHTALDSANDALKPDSALNQNTNDALRELARTAAALRTLADYLERHPEAIVRGKGEGR